MMNPKGTNKKKVAVKKTAQTSKLQAFQPETTIKEASEIMQHLEAENFPVVKGEKVAGTVRKKSDKKAAGFGHDPATTTVATSMSEEVVFLFEDQTIVEAEDLMNTHGLSHLPVVDKDLRIVGIISREEIRRQLE